MNIASTLIRRSGRLIRQPASQFRAFSNPVAPANKFNVIKRRGHGLKHYFQEWEALIFSHADYRLATMWITIPGLFATGVMFYCIWNSAWNDPEVRLRPHKRGWHFDEQRLARGEKYKGGSFRWVPVGWNPGRVDHIRYIYNNGFDEPGQIGYEELPIPSLDE
eukprot:187744_1